MVIAYSFMLAMAGTKSAMGLVKSHHERHHSRALEAEIEPSAGLLILLNNAHRVRGCRNAVNK